MDQTNRLFDRGMLEVLANPQRWRLENRGAAPAARSAAARAHGQWMAEHQHAHPQGEALVALRGRSVYGCGGRIYPCGPGSVLFFPPEEPHDQGYPCSSPDQEHLWLSLVGDQFFAHVIRVRGGCLRHLKHSHCVLTQEECGISGAALQGWANPETACPADVTQRRVLSALAVVVLAAVARGYAPRQSGPAGGDAHRRKIEAICRQIRETGGKGGDLNNLARIAGYSKFHFLRLFRRHTGRTVHQHVDACRREKVLQMRRDGVPCKVMAQELGFSCPASFSRWQRQHIRAGRRPRVLPSPTARSAL